MGSISLPESLQESLDNTKVEYVHLGQSGLRVSVPILGTSSLGSKAWEPWAIEEEEALPLLKYVYDRGLQTWDTSNNYSNGTSEAIIGKAIKIYEIPRQDLVLLTKCYFLATDDVAVRQVKYSREVAASKDYVNQFGLSRQAIFHQVEASLRRLGTSYIDILQIHRFDPSVPMEETMQALHDLVRSGKVRYIGASSMWATQFARMQFVAEKNGWTKFISMQCQYSLLYREEEREMLRFCRETGVGILAWAPLAQGRLARPFESLGTTIRSEPQKDAGLSEEDSNIVNRVQELASQKGWSMSNVALAWVKEKVSSPIVGASNVKKIEDVFAAKGKTLTQEEERYLEELYKPKPVTDHV